MLQQENADGQNSAEVEAKNAGTAQTSAPAKEEKNQKKQQSFTAL